MNRESNPSAFEYDIALSFASQDKVLAEELARLLTHRNISVFSDEYTGSEVWAKDVLDHLVNLYARKARYCVVLISRYYPLKTWTESEQMSVQERAFRDAREYILPVRLDETELSGNREARGYRDLRQDSMERIANWLEEKLGETWSESGPPPQSHDLRSGNVPSQPDESAD